MRDIEIEHALIGQLAGRGLRLAVDLSDDDRRERIRVAILMGNLEGKAMHYGPDRQRETYAGAYLRCYGQPIERRRDPRDAGGRPAAPRVETPQREDDEGDDDDEG